MLRRPLSRMPPERNTPMPSPGRSRPRSLRRHALVQSDDRRMTVATDSRATSFPVSSDVGAAAAPNRTQTVGQFQTAITMSHSDPSAPRATLPTSGATPSDRGGAPGLQGRGGRLDLDRDEYRVADGPLQFMARTGVTEVAVRRESSWLSPRLWRVACLRLGWKPLHPTLGGVRTDSAASQRFSADPPPGRNGGVVGSDSGPCICPSVIRAATTVEAASVEPSHVPSGSALLAIALSELARGIRGLDVLRRSVDRAPPRLA